MGGHAVSVGLRGRGGSTLVARRGLPGPWSRLVRHRPMLLATALAAAVAVAAGAAGDAAHLQVTSQVDAHWRGAYDILVRPDDSRLQLEQTAGVVEPNFLGFTGTGGITLDQLAGIRGLQDVELAAPVSFIGYITTTAAAPTIHFTKWPSQFTLYLAKVTIATSDGLSPLILYQQQVRVLLGPSPATGGPPTVLSDYGEGSVNQYPDGSYTADLYGDRLLPGILSPVLAIDPEAEQRLLGSTGGGLSALAQLSGQAFTAKTSEQLQIPPQFGQVGMDLARLASRPSTAGRPVFPLLVAGRMWTSLNVRLDVSQLGSPISKPIDVSGAPSQVLDLAAHAAGSTVTAAGQVTADVGNELLPFAPAMMVVGWPGSSMLKPSGMFKRPSDFRPALSGRPAYKSATAPVGLSGLAFEIEQKGVADAGGDIHGSGPATVATATEQTYRTLDPVGNPLLKSFISTAAYDAPFVFAPVGTFDMADFAPAADPLTYVPLGAYDPPDTTYVADPSGHPVTPRAMTPTLNPAGLIQVPPLAIADLSAAAAFRGSAPIDAIRVRVTGLSGFDEGAKAKVERVASQIAAMGLDVDIVAGSSPQTVDVYVPAYDTSVNPPADLGWVEQHWTTLGAATRVVEGLGDTNAALLGLATLALLIVIAGLEVLFATTRRRDAAILAAVGWNRAARVRWQASEALTAGIAVTAVGLAAWSVLGRSPAALAVVLLIGAAFPVAGLVAALVVPVSAGTVVSGGRGGAILRRIPVDGLTAFTLRSLVARPARTGIMILALGAAAATTGPSLALVASVGLRVGPTRLAGAVGAQLAPYQLGLLALAAAGSVAFALVALRSSVADRDEELRALVASGWLPVHVRGLMRRERVVIAGPAALLAAAIAWIVAAPVTEATPIASAAVAALLALSIIAWGGLVARPAVLRPVRAGGAPSSRRRSIDGTGIE